MKVSEQFLKARKAKGLNYFVVRNEASNGVKRTYVRLVFDERSKITGEVNSVSVECDTEVRFNLCRNAHLDHDKIGVCFSELIYTYSHINTFLNAIKKDSDVMFEVVAYNGSQVLDEAGLVHHTLYGFIGENKYMLCDFVGRDNSATPVKQFIPNY